MTDILINFDDAFLSGDVSQIGAVLETDNSIRTGVYVSLFTDGRAGSRDELPADQTDPRGWWGDVLSSEDGDRIGTRRWLYIREKQTLETAEKVRSADRAALQWLIEDGIAADVSVEVEWIRRGVLGERIIVTKPSGDNIDFSFNHLWEGL